MAISEQQNIDLAIRSITNGSEFPYDASDEWWDCTEGVEIEPARDAAHAAARGILADLKDRRGIKRGFDRVEEKTRVEIVERLAEIIRQAMEMFPRKIKPVQPPPLSPEELKELEDEEASE